MQYPQIKKSVGLTDSERLLSALCYQTFLGLWSYPNVFKARSKELCDVLIVCDRDVLIFSDKSCAFKNSGRIKIDWHRWYKNAVLSSARQISGAERWIRQHPDRLFLDAKCETTFPLEIPRDSLRVTRVIVARGIAAACQRRIGGSGSLVLRPQEKLAACSDLPFEVGCFDEDGRMYHVLDDVTLTLLLNELDTVVDLIDYFRTKEQFFRSEKVYSVQGEENLLAAYFEEVDANGKHYFKAPSDDQIIFIQDGLWKRASQSAAYKSRATANKISYFWDWLIEELSHHTLNGTLKDGGERSVRENEVGIRQIALEPRLSRRALSSAFLGRFWESVTDKVSIRTHFDYKHSDRAYVFLFMPNMEEGGDEELYRSKRQNYLANYSFVLASQHRHLKEVVGIATEPQGIDQRSHDFQIYRPAPWSAENIREAKLLQERMDVLFKHKLKRRQVHMDEFPAGRNNCNKPDDSRNNWPGRNDPCPCGSGKKFKKCCR